jgi:hypothetical protein
VTNVRFISLNQIREYDYFGSNWYNSRHINLRGLHACAPIEKGKEPGDYNEHASVLRFSLLVPVLDLAVLTLVNHFDGGFLYKIAVVEPFSSCLTLFSKEFTTCFLLD